MIFNSYTKIEISGMPDIRGGEEIDAINKLAHGDQGPFRPTDLAMVVWAVEHGHRIPLMAFDHDNNRVFTAETIIGAATRADGNVQAALVQMYESAARLIGAAQVLNQQESESAEGR